LTLMTAKMNNLLQKKPPKNGIFQTPIR